MDADTTDGVRPLPHDHSGFAEFGCNACEAAADEEREAAEQAFLDASVAVWRAIDAAMANGPYKGLEVTERGVELRRVEREAWERYRRCLDGD